LKVISGGPVSAPSDLWSVCLGLLFAASSKIRRVMNLVFKHGQTYRLIPRTEEANPLKFVRVKTQSEYEAKVITPEQCFEILMAMPPLEPTLTLLIAATGLRVSECLGLQWADIDYENRQIQVRRKWTGGKLVSQRVKRARLQSQWCR